MWDCFATNYYSDGVFSRRYNIWYSVVFMFALFGIIRVAGSRLNINILLPFSLFAYFSVVMMMSGDPRHRYPLESLLIIFASAGIIAIYERFRNRIFSYAVIAAVVGMNLLCYRYSDSFLGFVRYLLKLIMG